MPNPQNQGVLQIGPYSLQSIPSGTFALDGGSMFGVAPRPLWEKTNTPDDQNRIDLGMRLLLIRGPSRTYLIDTGIGDKFNDKQNAIYKVNAVMPDEALRAAGVDPAGVTDVILTHLHFDHAGGATRADGSPSLPQARYHIQHEQLEWAREPAWKDRGSFRPDDFMPLQREGQFTIHSGRTEIEDGIELLPVDGHTRAMQLVKVSDGDTTLLYCADLVPTRGHLRPPFIMSYDNEPLKTLEEKQHLLGLAAAEDWILFFEHDASCAAGRIRRGTRGFDFREEVTI